MAALDAGRTRADRAAQSDDLTVLAGAVRLFAQSPDGVQQWLREQLETPTSPRRRDPSRAHRVKGLEWDYVVVFGADRGSMPDELSDDIEEERRVSTSADLRAAEVAILVDQARPLRFLAELDGSAPVEAEALTARRDLAPARFPLMPSSSRSVTRSPSWVGSRAWSMRSSPPARWSRWPVAGRC